MKMESLPLTESGREHKNWIRRYLCNPRHFIYRAIVLFLTCMIGFGSFFCYDNPAALQTMFIKDLSLTYESYMGLYAWYSWPNIIMSFVGGILVDNVLGIRMGTTIFGILTIIGQILLSVGVFVNRIWLMYLGRFIFGIGAESIAVAQNTYAVRWFKDKELNVVFGLQLSISRLGSALNPNVMPDLYKALEISYSDKLALGLSLVVSSITCIISLIFCIILGFLDFRAFKKPGLAVNENNHLKLNNYMEIIKFSYGIWALCFICLLFYSSIFPFVSLAQTLFVQKYQISVIKANLANSLIYLVSAILSPIIGFGVDYFGKNLIYLTCGLVFLLISHILLAFTIDIPPYFITVLMGLAYSTISSSLWGLVAYMVPRSKQGTVFGLMQALMNLGLGVVALISGYLVDNYGYLILELFFIISVTLSLCTLFVLFHWSNQNGGILNLSTKKRLRLNIQ